MSPVHTNMVDVVFKSMVSAIARMLERDLSMVNQQQLSGILGFLLIFQVSAEARDKFKLMGSGSSDAPARCRTQVSSRPKWCT